MYLKGGEENKHTGFVVIYDDDSKVFEINDYYNKRLKRKCATNWVDIDKNRIKTLQLYWCGDLKVQINKSSPDVHKNILEAEDWFFSHKGYFDTSENKIKIISRNIGYKEDNLLYVYSVMEDTGEVIANVRVCNSN